MRLIGMSILDMEVYGLLVNIQSRASSVYLYGSQFLQVIPFTLHHASNSVS